MSNENENNTTNSRFKGNTGLAIVAIVAIVAIALAWWKPWATVSEKVIDGNVRITGNLTVDKNATVKDNLVVNKDATVKGQLTAATIVSETDILAKRNIVANETVQAKIVQATEKVIAPEVDANIVNTKVLNTEKVNITSVSTVNVQPVQQPIAQYGSGSSNSFTSGDPEWHTGVGITKTVIMNVLPGKTAVVGGYLVNGLRGDLKPYSPGTYTLTICDGFIRDNVDPSNTNATLQMKKDEAIRLGQDVTNAQ